MNELKKIAKVIRENESFFITSHIRPDGDSIGSQLALKRILEKLGKEVTIANHDSAPKIYDFLTGRESIKQELPKDREFDVALVLDSPELSRLESTVEAIKKAKVIINIDHHLGNKRFGKYNYVDTEASAVGEEIYEGIFGVTNSFFLTSVTFLLLVALVLAIIEIISIVSIIIKRIKNIQELEQEYFQVEVKK